MKEQENPQKLKYYKQGPNECLKNENYNVWNNEYFTKWTPQWTRDEERNVQGNLNWQTKAPTMKWKEKNGGKKEKIKSMWECTEWFAQYIHNFRRRAERDQRKYLM